MVLEMGFFFTNHILDRCDRRSIQRELVLRVVESPQKFYEIGDFCYFEGQGIKVVARKQNQYFILITTYNL